MPATGTPSERCCETVGALERLEWDALPPPPPTNYERKYKAEGRPIWRFLLVREA